MRTNHLLCGKDSLALRNSLEKTLRTSLGTRLAQLTPIVAKELFFICQQYSQGLTSYQPTLFNLLDMNNF
jgi:uncharacterized protein (UPF0262 family)